jgi:polar amino acid transport system substrate-binding protein
MRRREFIIGLFSASASQTSGGALGQSSVSSEIAPMGKLRCGSVDIQVLGGVAQPVGKFIAMKLGVSFEPIMYPNPEAYVASFGKGEWDIAIGPSVLAAAEQTDSGADVWLIELIYVAAPGRTFADGQVDRPGVKVGVIQGDPSDRYLSLNLKSAEIVRIPLNAHISDDVIELLRSGKSDVFGTDSGVGSSVIKGLPGAKIVGAFNLVRVAVSLPNGRSSAAQAKLAELINEAKRTGIVRQAIAEAGLHGVYVAPD